MCKEPGILIRPSLYESPQILTVASEIKKRPMDVVGYMVRVLSWAVAHAAGDNSDTVFGSKLGAIDILTGEAGLGRAMAVAGMIDETIDGLVFHDLATYSTRRKPRAKRTDNPGSPGPLTNAERQAIYRQRRSNGKVTPSNGESNAIVTPSNGESNGESNAIVTRNNAIVTRNNAIVTPSNDEVTGNNGESNGKVTGSNDEVTQSNALRNGKVTRSNALRNDEVTESNALRNDEVTRSNALRNATSSLLPPPNPPQEEIQEREIEYMNSYNSLSLTLNTKKPIQEVSTLRGVVGEMQNGTSSTPGTPKYDTTNETPPDRLKQETENTRKAAELAAFYDKTVTSHFGKSPRIAFKLILDQGDQWAALRLAIANYGKWCDSRGISRQYRKSANTFLMDDYWKTYADMTEQELQAPPQEPVDNEQARIKAIRDKIAELND